MFDTSEDHPTAPLIRTQLAEMGLRWIQNPSWNETVPALYQQAVARGEAKVMVRGALAITTGAHTGRSPKDKFIVRDETTATAVWWDNNQAMNPQHFAALREDFMAYARLKTLFIQDLEACADPAQTTQVRVITEHAWHGLFMRHLLKPAADLDFVSDLTIINFPGFKAEPGRHGTHSDTVIAFDFKQRLVLIGGTAYAGEMKKAVFTYLNYILPNTHVLPMHCAANIGPRGDTAIFFGLSGTGKTTLSADPTRPLIGDDEHGWSESGIFNIENGCYAKALHLTAAAEPQIYQAAQQFGSILENVGHDKETREANFTDSSLTENTRVAYSLSAITHASASRMGPAPKTIIMLTADAFGVLPPIARLDPAQAMRQFLAGYTAKLAGTERGVRLPQATFSACFGAPFLPRHPTVYADMLTDLMARHETRCFLLNTGWTGGAFGVGTRILLSTTRKLLQAALSGALDLAPTRIDPHFGFAVPLMVPGVEDKILDPRACWLDGKAYDAAAKNLAVLYEEALAKFSTLEGSVLQAAE